MISMLLPLFQKIAQNIHFYGDFAGQYVPIKIL